MNGEPHDFGIFTNNGSQEFRLTTGDPTADVSIMIIPPLFDEMNRMRRVLVSAARLLGRRGIFAIIPDLPGTNESLSPLSEQTLSHWRSAIIEAARGLRVTHVVSIRSGALIDDGLIGLPHWRLAPQKGSSVIKTMIRTCIASDKENGINSNTDALMELGRTNGLELGGNSLGAQMIVDLENAVPNESGKITVAQLGENGLIGSALWLRAEPQDDPKMAESLAENWDIWSASCGE